MKKLFGKFKRKLTQLRLCLVYLLLPKDARRQLDNMVYLNQSHFLTITARLDGQDFVYDASWLKRLQKKWFRHAGKSNVESWPLIGNYAIYYEGHKPEVPYRAYGHWHQAQEAADEKNEEALFYHEEPLWKVYKFR